MPWLLVLLVSLLVGAALVYGLYLLFFAPPPPADEVSAFEPMCNGVAQSEEKSEVNDPYFQSDKLLPKNSPDDPEWADDFKKADNMLLQQNFIDANAGTEQFQITRSVCGRRYMSTDIRRVPTVTRDPATINSFNLPVIDPVCAKEYNDMHGNLDYDCKTQTWVKDQNSLAALGYPLPKNSMY